MNQWSLVLSVAGLVLGIVSAYPQLRDLTSRLLRMSAESTHRWAQRLYDRADFFIECPSALIAFIAHSCFVLAAIFLVAAMTAGRLSENPMGLPEWALLCIRLVAVFLMGNIGADLANTVRVVTHRAKQQHFRHRGGG